MEEDEGVKVRLIYGRGWRGESEDLSLEGGEGWSIYPGSIQGGTWQNKWNYNWSNEFGLAICWYLC